MLDLKGQEVSVGDVVYYSTISTYTSNLNYGVVVEILEETGIEMATIAPDKIVCPSSRKVYISETESERRLCKIA